MVKYLFILTFGGVNLEQIFDSKKGYVESQSYESLILNLYRDLYRYIYIIVRNNVIAEDVIQETFFKGYYHFKDLKDKEKFKSWIYTIAKRESLATLKRYSREIATDTQEDEYIFDSEFYIEEKFEHKLETLTALKKVLSDLDSESKDIVFLIYYDKLTLEEISDMLNIKLNTLKSKHKRIKEKLYNKLKEMSAL
jgi:RNA polymerase sigma factor, sigma-70 family